MAYTLPAWANNPSTATPLSAANLTLANTAINSLDSRAGVLELARFNVKSPTYGATGNGSTDDATAIQAALTAAGAAGGGTVFLPAATYATTKCLNVPSNVTLMGDGMGVTTIKAISGLMTGSNGGINGGYSVLEQSSTATGNIVIRDLTVNANHSAVGVVSGSANRQNAGVVDFRALTGVSFINVEVKDGWFYHLTVWTSTDVLVQGCKVTGPGTSGVYDQLDGIHLTCCTRQAIVDCQIDMGVGTDGDDGIALHQFPSSGIDVVDAVVADNRIRGGNNGSGIDLANADGTIKGVTITGNLIHDGTNKGVVTNWFGFFTGTTQDVTIVGNTIRDCAGGSIVLGDLTGNNAPYSLFRVSGNQCSRSNGQPLQISTTNASNISIERASLPPTTLTDGATVSLDASNGRVFNLTAVGNRTIAVPSGATLDGQEIVIAHTASGGSRTLALTTGSTGAFAFGTTITALSATTSGLTDYITCVYSAAALRWRVVQYVKGF